MLLSDFKRVLIAYGTWKMFHPLLGIANRSDSNNLNSKVYKGLLFVVLSHTHFQIRIIILDIYHSNK